MPADRTVQLRCLKAGCPRTKKISFDADTMPEKTIIIETFCPWHDDGGGKGPTEFYYDKAGKPLCMM